MRIGFTGTHHGMTEPQKARFRQALPLELGEFHHGDCIGADAEAHDIADSFGFEPVIHPPDNPIKRAFKPGRILAPKPYLERNHDIVYDTERMIATPREFEEQLKSGTWATIRFTRKLGRPLTIIYPDGSCGG